jgi:hypothetical protein
VKHVHLVLSDAVPGKEDEFNEWYRTHLREVANTPGFVAAQLFKLSAPNLSGDATAMSTIDTDNSPNSYLVIYEVTDDIDAAKAALIAGRPTRVPVPDAMAPERHLWWFTAVSDRVTAD